MTDVDERTLPVPTLPVPTSLDAAGRDMIFGAARTANTWSEEPVSDAELAEVWEMARWAPTAANFQPMRVLFVRTPEGRERLLPHINEGNRLKTASAPVVAVLAMDSRFHETIPTVMPPMAGMVEKLDGNEPLRTTMATFNSSLQAGYFILAVRAAGLSAGPMAGFDAAGIDGEFFADGRWRSILVVSIGHPGPDAHRPRMPRLDPEQALRWE